MQERLLGNKLRNMLLKKEAQKISGIFNKKGIIIAFSKGIQIIERYKENKNRYVGDIDFLILKKDVYRVRTILKQNGYKNKSSLNDSFRIKYGYHLTYSKVIKNITINIEPHWDILYNPNPYNLDPNEFLKNRKKGKLSFTKKEYMIIWHIVSVFYHDFFRKSLRELYDFYIFLNDKTLDKDLLYNLLKKTRTFPIYNLFIYYMDLFFKGSKFNKNTGFINYKSFLPKNLFSSKKINHLQKELFRLQLISPENYYFLINKNFHMILDKLK